MWSALRLELPPEDRSAIVDHVAKCATCAEEWRIAAELMPDREEILEAYLKDSQQAIPPAALLLKGAIRVKYVAAVVAAVIVLPLLYVFGPAGLIGPVVNPTSRTPTGPVTAERHVAPNAQPRTLNLGEFLAAEYVSRGLRESLVTCSGVQRTTMIQLTEAMPERHNARADGIYYVLGGEGTVSIGGRVSKVSVSEIISVPRGTSHSFEKLGTRPLILLAVFSGVPCEQSEYEPEVGR